MVALTRISEMFFCLLIHSSGVVQLLKIFLVSGSMCACCVTFNAFFNLRFMPLVFGEGVSLNTIGVGLLLCDVVWF